MPFGIEFVGEDVINAYLRMNIHGSSVCEIVINHFKNACSGRKFTIQILAKLTGNGFTNGAIDSQVLEYTLQCQGYWIKTPQAVYPFVLNQRIKFTCTNSIRLLPSTEKIHR